MNHVAEQTQDDLEVVILDEQEPVILDFEEEAARLQVCEYCGHLPCGCGG